MSCNNSLVGRNVDFEERVRRFESPSGKCVTSVVSTVSNSKVVCEVVKVEVVNVGRKYADSGVVV